MKFEDLTNAQLKKVIKNYRLHLLKELTGYTKLSREDLINLCKKLFDIDDEKIKPKITEPIYFDIPKGKQPKAEKMKKVITLKEKTQIKTVSERLINEFVKLSEEEKKEVAKSLANTRRTTKENINYFMYVRDYSYIQFRKYFDKLLFDLNPKEFQPDYTNEGKYIKSILPHLQNRPEVIASNKTRFYAKKEEILRPLMKELEEVFDKNGKLARIWSQLYIKISDSIRRSENE